MKISYLDNECLEYKGFREDWNTSVYKIQPKNFKQDRCYVFFESIEKMLPIISVVWNLLYFITKSKEKFELGFIKSDFSHKFFTFPKEYIYICATITKLFNMNILKIPTVVVTIPIPSTPKLLKDKEFGLEDLIYGNFPLSGQDKPQPVRKDALTRIEKKDSKQKTAIEFPKADNIFHLREIEI